MNPRHSSDPHRPGVTTRFRITVAYDGTAYSGWQVQPRHTTIQGEIERVLKELTGETVRVECSGRTDAGVHAAAQVAHFDLACAAKPAKLLLGLNALLRPDIRVLRLARTRPDFHARFDAAGKEYRYFIWNAAFAPPWLRLYRAAVRRPLDVAAMRSAARQLAGHRDFAAFSANPHREIAGTVRHLRRLTVTRRGHEVVIAATGDGFLYKMVRSLAGFLIRVGTGELDPAQATRILDSKLRTAVVPTAPAAGLFLWRVRYGRRQREKKS